MFVRVRCGLAFCLYGFLFPCVCCSGVAFSCLYVYMCLYCAGAVLLFCYMRGRFFCSGVLLFYALARLSVSVVLVFCLFMCFAFVMSCPCCSGVMFLCLLCLYVSMLVWC